MKGVDQLGASCKNIQHLTHLAKLNIHYLFQCICLINFLANFILNVITADNTFLIICYFDMTLVIFLMDG